MAIASRLAPTGSVSATHIVEASLPMICGQREPVEANLPMICGQRKPVGAGLPAIGPVHPTSPVTDPTPSTVGASLLAMASVKIAA
ncbi:hypothetical protein [Pseudomonas sp. B11(2017)]|uniref:hypothetical protein n=1 Tax=Pseudomonas sp. B11(2017) TaxID=1981748 RepID=UPI000A1ECFF5|nr:hypothetical protein [Pseudomonas sp. B11(2017)]